MSVDANGFGPGTPYLASTEKIPAEAKWIQITCPTCGHNELLELIRVDGVIEGFRFAQAHIATLPPDAKEAVERQRAEHRLAFSNQFPSASLVD